MPDHSPSTDERAALAQPSQSSSPLECTSHLGFSLVCPTRVGVHRIPTRLVASDMCLPHASGGPPVGYPLNADGD